MAANRLMEALNNNGVKAKMLVRDKETDSLSVVGLRPSMWSRWHFLWERWCIFWHLRFSRKHLFELDIANSGIDITRTREFREADLIHLHWINQGMLALGGIRRILNSGKYVNDKKEGVWVFYNVHEKKIREQNFVHDVPEGKFTEYYDNGAKHFEGNFKDRLRDGKWSCWRPNGKLFYSVLFSRGHKVKELYVADPKEGRPF